VVKSRSLIVFALLVLWTAIPALSCLPTQGMTQEEMACCKKMAGDCQKSADHHPCCKTAVNRMPSVAKIERETSQVQPFIVGMLLESALLPEPTLTRAPNKEKLGLPPPGPPSLTSILRI
jgi:hypothetical protein